MDKESQYDYLTQRFLALGAEKRKVRPFFASCLPVYTFIASVEN